MQALCREGGLQQAPCGVEAVVQQIGLILLDIEVNGVGGAVGQMHIVPRILAARLRLVLLAGHPDRQSFVVQQQPVEGAGQAHLFDLEAQGVEERPEIDGRNAQRHHGQHHREQGCAVFLAHLRQAEAGRHQQNGRERQRPVPRLAVAQQVEGGKIVEGCSIHLDGNGDRLRHKNTLLFGHSTILFSNNQG